MSSKKKEKRDPAYLREQGNRNAVLTKQRNITFCLAKHIQGEGQSIEEWNESGLLEKLFIRMKYIGQHSVHEIKLMKWIKEYHKIGFPQHSEFSEPKHVTNVTWAVMHLSDKSKEVVIGYLEDDVFYVVFLDKNHKFWPTEKKNT